MSHVNRFGDADLADRSGPEYAWMDRVVARSRADGAPIDRQQLDRLTLDSRRTLRVQWRRSRAVCQGLMADLEDAIVDKLRRGYRVNLGPVMLHPDGTAA